MEEKEDPNALLKKIKNLSLSIHMKVTLRKRIEVKKPENVFDIGTKSFRKAHLLEYYEKPIVEESLIIIHENMEELELDNSYLDDYEQEY